MTRRKAVSLARAFLDQLEARQLTSGETMGIIGELDEAGRADVMAEISTTRRRRPPRPAPEAPSVGS